MERLNPAEQLEIERDQLRRELLGVQEMLAFVLLTVGEPVVVTKESLSKGLPPNVQIAVDEDLENNAFRFYLVGGEEQE